MVTAFKCEARRIGIGEGGRGRDSSRRANGIVLTLPSKADREGGTSEKRE